MEVKSEESPFCIYFTKLQHFYLVICSRILHKLLQQEIDKQNVSNFVNFLNNNTETLFHLRGKKCCCNKWQKNEVLNKDQWNYLFNLSTSSNQCPRNQKNCFHSYTAQQCLTVEKVDFSLACVLLRNICDSVNKNNIQTLQSQRNQFVHNPLPLDQDEFELLWRKAMASLCNVANDLPVGVKQQICEEADMIYNYKERLTRYIETTLCEVTEHIKENLFSPIKVLEFVVNTLEKHGIAIIVGYPGSGKSHIGKEVLRIMHSNDEIVLKVDEVKLWNELVNPSFGYIVFIDDFLGESNLDTAKLTKLKGYFNTIYACVKNTKTKVVLTVRKSIYERWRDQLEETSSRLFEPDYIIDLTKEEHQLSYEEKKSMLTKHLQHCKIQIVRTKKEAAESSNLIDQFTVEAISSTTPFNFPLLCLLFSRSKNIRLGPKFFEHPRDTLVKTIDKFRKSQVSKDRNKYTVLSYCAISGNKVSCRKLDIGCITSICNSLEPGCFKEGNEVKVLVRDAVEDLKDEYFREIGKDTYEFIHQSFLEATILSCGEVFPGIVIDHCSKDTLFELIRTNNYEEGKGELVLKLNEDNYDKLITRFMKEIKSSLKVIPRVFLNPVMEDNVFYQQFLARLGSLVSAEDTPQEVVNSCLIESSRLGQLRGVKVCLSSKIPQHVFEAALNHASYNNRAEVVVFLSTARTEEKLNPYFLQACSFGCKDVVCAMFDNGIIQDVDLIQEGIVRSTKANHVNTSLVLIKVYCSKADTRTFKKTMIKIIIDAIEAEKADIVKEIISDRNIIRLNDEDIINLVLEACLSNQLDLAKFFLNTFCILNRINVFAYIERFLAGSRSSIDMVFEMKDFFEVTLGYTVFNLRTFLNSKRNIDHILTSTAFGCYVIERAFACFPLEIKLVCSSPDVIRHLLWIGGHSVIFELCQKDAELTQSLKTIERFVKNYTFVEFAAFCGFPNIEMFAHDCWHQRDSLFFLCIEGYKISGRSPIFEVEFSYKCKYSGVNFFETTSRQSGYATCLKKLYNETIRLTNDSPEIKSILNIMCETFESETFEIIRDFLNFRNINSSRFFPISSAKMDVLQFLRHILLQQVNVLQVEEMFDSFAEFTEY